MGYPWGKTYLEQIQERKEECEHIAQAYYVLERKYLREHNKADDVEISLSEMFSILGEAFEHESSVLSGVNDLYHFMWDVIDALLTTKEEKDGK